MNEPMLTGVVELGEGVTLDDASRAFWHHVAEIGARSGFWLDITKAKKP